LFDEQHIGDAATESELKKLVAGAQEPQAPQGPAVNLQAKLRSGGACPALRC